MEFRVTQKIAFFCQGKVLVLKRSAEEDTRPGAWDIVGGKVETGDLKEGEDALTLALLREAREEIGVEIVATKLKVVFSLGKYFSDTDRFTVWLGYRYDFPETPEIHLSWEHPEFRWVDPSEVVEMDFDKGDHWKEVIRRAGLVQSD
jgi:8-oxo-dGTP diphosphatase